MKKEKIALFGGSFNPIHNGHMELANTILDRNYATQVWFVPCGEHAFDKNLIHPFHRLKMLELATKNKPNMKVVDFEAIKFGKSFTADTIKWFKDNYGTKPYLIIGSDLLKDFDKWHDFEYIKKNSNVIAFRRPGSEIDTNIISPTIIVEERSQVSSTQVRDAASKKESLTNLVDENVEIYMRKNGLYVPYISTPKQDDVVVHKGHLTFVRRPHEKRLYDVALSKDAAVMLYIDDEDMVYLTKQFRPAIGREVIALPAETLDKPGLTPLEVMVEGLHEECGIKIGLEQVEAIGPVISTDGHDSEHVYQFIAKGSGKHLGQRLEDSEKITVIKLPFDQVYKMVIDNVLQGTKTRELVLYEKLRRTEQVN